MLRDYQRLVIRQNGLGVFTALSFALGAFSQQPNR